MGCMAFLSLNPNKPEMRMDLGIVWRVEDDDWKYFICTKRRKRKGIICEAAVDLEKKVSWGRLSHHLQPETWLKSPW